MTFFPDDLFFGKFGILSLTSLGKGRGTNVPPDFQNSSKKLFHIDSELLRSRAGVGASGTPVPMGTRVPAGTHRNFENLGTAGYRVPSKF